MRVTSGQFTARGCAFNGAAQRVDRTTGAGLGARGDAQLRLEDCDFSGNRTGLRVESDVVCEVCNCRFANNATAGVQGRGSARLSVRDCAFDANERCAVMVHGDSTAHLADNHVHDSGYHGIQATESAQVELTGNHCEHNEGAESC